MTISDGMAGPKDGWEGTIVMRLDRMGGRVVVVVMSLPLEPVVLHVLLVINTGSRVLPYLDQGSINKYRKNLVNTYFHHTVRHRTVAEKPQDCVLAWLGMCKPVCM